MAQSKWVSKSSNLTVNYIEWHSSRISENGKYLLKSIKWPILLNKQLFAKIESEVHLTTKHLLTVIAENSNLVIGLKIAKFDYFIVSHFLDQHC